MDFLCIVVEMFLMLAHMCRRSKFDNPSELVLLIRTCKHVCYSYAIVVSRFDLWQAGPFLARSVIVTVSATVFWLMAAESQTLQD